MWDNCQIIFIIGHSLCYCILLYCIIVIIITTKPINFLLIPDITLKLYFEFRNFLGAVVIVVVSTDSCYSCLSDYEPLIF